MSRNPFKRFLDLLPQHPLQVGDVIDYDGGVALIELPGGGRTKARGDAQIGERVFFRDGVIEGQAPVLPVELIEI